MWGKRIDGCTETENEAPDKGAGETEDKLLLDRRAGAEPGNEHGCDGGRDARPIDGLIDDVTQGCAQTKLEREGNRLGLA